MDLEADRLWPPGARLRPSAPAIELSSAGPGSCVEIEDSEEASSSAVLNQLVEVDVLFFLGSGGRIFPGSSVRNLLCSFAKSPYLFAT